MEYLRNFINDNCIFRCYPGTFVKGCRSNEVYSWQFYLRRAIFNQRALMDIVSGFAQFHNNEYQYAAMETAGPPLLSALMNYMSTEQKSVDGFAIRKTQKAYGLYNWIEGDAKDKPVIIIDDVANSKTTIERAAEICIGHGLEVAGAMTIVNKKRDAKDVNGIPVMSLFSVDDFDLTWEAYYANRLAPTLEEFGAAYGSILLKDFEGTGNATIFQEDSFFA